MKKRRLTKFSGYVATSVIIFAGITPTTFNIPTALHPWVFLVTIVWIVVYSSGAFSS